MLKFLLLLLATLVPGTAAAWPVFSAPPPSLTLSVSPSTIWGGWTTPGAGDSNMSCTPAAGGSPKSGVDNGIQAGVTNHSVIVAGLLASTPYNCSATTVDAATGATITLTASATTTAFPASTPVTGVTYGVPVNQNPGGRGDTYYNFIALNNSTYSTSSDGGGLWGGACSSFAQSVYRLTSEVAPYTAVALNCQTAFGAEANCLASDANVGHISGIYAHLDVNSQRDILYAFLTRETSYPANPACAFESPSFAYKRYAGGIIKSLDGGATWANWQAPSSPSANSVVATPPSASWFCNNTTMIQPSPVLYGADDGTLGYRIDNADAYLYNTSADIANFNGDNVYLTRIALAKLPNLSSGDIQYYIGGDGTFDAAWSSSCSGIAPIITNAGKLSQGAISYNPKSGRYVVFYFYYPTFPGAGSGAFSSSSWPMYEAPHVWGPYTLVDDHAWSDGYYIPSPLQRSTLAGSLLNVWTTISFTLGSGYNPWTVSAQLKCSGVNC